MQLAFKADGRIVRLTLEELAFDLPKLLTRRFMYSHIVFGWQEIHVESRLDLGL